MPEANVPIFTVLRRVDAFIDYTAEVEASDANDAAKLAATAEEKFSWKSAGTAQFDDRVFVTLDQHGNEIEGTKQGDF